MFAAIVATAAASILARAVARRRRPATAIVPASRSLREFRADRRAYR